MRFDKQLVLRFERAAALVELSISIVIMFLIMGGCWMLLSAEDVRHTVVSSVYAGLNRPQNQVFQTDIAGSLKKYDATTVQPLIDSISAEVSNRFSDSSPLSAWLSGLNCNFQLNYIPLAAGVPDLSDLVARPFITIPGDPGGGGSPHKAFTLAKSESDGFLARLTARKIQPANSKVQFFSEYHFPNPPNPIPSPEEFYFDEFAFFSWGCVVQRDLFFMDIDTTLSGVFVPNRML